METRKMVCINCPLGCSLEVTIDNENVEVKGNQCKRGQEYAIIEIHDPRRILTSTVKVIDGEKPLVSVKTDKEIPKKLLFEAMKVINQVEIKAPVNIGDVILENIIGTDAKVVATSGSKKLTTM